LQEFFYLIVHLGKHLNLYPHSLQLPNPSL
jgi:hypothetical protein